MLVDFDDVFIEHAIKHGFVSPEQVEECRQLQKQEQDGGRRYYLGQILIRRRYLTCTDFLQIENDLGQKLYECMTCKARYGRSDLTSAGTVQCKGCGAELRVEAAGLSVVEILASRDPRDLTISLCPATPPSAAVPQPMAVVPSVAQPIDPKTPGAPGAVSARAAVVAADPPRSQTTRQAKSKLNRAVLELTRDELTGLQRYEILEELGRGGMGIVFKAKQVDIDRVCALKVIKASANVPEVQINRFVQEARAAAQLNHPNIVTIYDFGRFRDMFYIAMEYIEGKVLAKMIAEEKIPVEKAIGIAENILDAIEYAHQKGVIHRDLKPQNILVENERGRGRLIDFGLAKDFSAGLGLTQTGQILGSPFYLSPEQTRGESRNVDARSDVFAMGVILYEMLTKTRPFTGRSAAEVYGKILKERPVPPGIVEPDVDQILQEIVLQALEKEPKDRFQSADAMKRALAQYREDRDTRSDLERVPKSGLLKQASGRASGSGTNRAPIHKRSSDRTGVTGAAARRTSASIAVPNDPTAPRAAKASGSGSTLAAVLALLLGGGAVIALVLSQHGGGQAQTGESPRPGESSLAPPSPIGSATRTPDADSTEGPARADDWKAIRELELCEERNPNDWGTLITRWKELAEAYPKRKEQSLQKRSEFHKGAETEYVTIVQGVESHQGKLEESGAAAQLLSSALPRYEQTEWEPKLKAKLKEITDGALEFARIAVAQSEDLLAKNDFEGAIQPLTKTTHTGIADADKLLEDQRRRVSTAKRKAMDDAEARKAKGLEELARRKDEALDLIAKRRYGDALALLGEVLTKSPPEELATQVSALLFEVRLLHSVLSGASKPDMDAVKASRREVDLEVGNKIHGVLVRAKDGIIVIRVAGGGESDCAIATLPPKTVAKLFDLAHGSDTAEGALAKAFFLVHEGEADAARAAFDDAKKKGADTSRYEARFAELEANARDPSKRPGATTAERPSPAPTQKPDARPSPAVAEKDKKVRDDGAQILVPAGEFMMGASGQPNHDDQYPARKVRLNAFYIDKYEVSNHQYQRFLDATKGHHGPWCADGCPKSKDHTPASWGSPRFGGDAHPVVGVDWYDAFAYARWAKKRLPTEAEWERAARGTESKTYPWGNDWDPKKCVCAEHWMKKSVFEPAEWDGWLDFLKTAVRVTLPVDSLDEGRSPTGCYNMAGNVAEWVQDFYGGSYYRDQFQKPYESFGGPNDKGPVDKNPKGPDSGAQKVVRGGSWNDRFANDTCQAICRTPCEPRVRETWLGFRCAADAEGQ